MNHIYRLVWSTVTNDWIAVAETARGRGKGARRRLVAAALSVGSLAAQAGPTGGQVVAGNGTIAQSGATTTITQATPNLSLNWSTFNIAPQETVNFVQPSSTAIAVNRIFDTNGTQILGHLNANGQVFLINPNGILFGEGAQVNVGGLVASTLDWSGTATGNSISFSGSGSGSVVNRGTISAADGGYVAFLGNHVENQGVIGAQLGTVALGAGSAVTLAFDGRSLIHAQVDQNLLNGLAANGGLIRADGGQVVMTAGAKDALLTSVVNNSGTIEARTVNSQAGRIVLLGGMGAGTVNVGGTLDASAPNGGPGGFIETSAAHVKVGDNAKVTTLAANGKSGTWLIDPTDFTIAASGGDETGIALSSALNSGNVQILSSSGASGTQGNINVNAPVTWTANTLTLTAANDVNINAVMTVNNTAALDLEPASGKVNVGMNAAGAFIGQVNFFQADGVTPRSGTGFLTIDGNAYTVVTNLGTAASSADGTLQGIGGNLAGFYALGSNINASATVFWSGGFTPIGNGNGAFSGVFDGLGHTISNLIITRPSTDLVGLFGAANSASAIRNVALVSGSVNGNNNVGALVGSNYGAVSNSYTTDNVTGANNFIGGLVGLNQTSGKVNNSYATGSVNGPYNVGGLVGYNHDGAINNSYATGAVTGIQNNAGGLVGAGSGAISNSYATGAVSGNTNVGGLMGQNYGTVSSSYAMGNVSGGNYVGGLVGTNHGTAISNSYATGTATGTNIVGGLVGLNYGTVSSSYTTGNVSGSNYVGGLVGTNRGTVISNSYATGTATGTNMVGGLVGQNYGTVSNSYATGNVSGSGYVGGLVGANNGTIISNSYATGSATGTSIVGGLVGINYGTVSNSYATGSVNGTNQIGGLVGNTSGAITYSYAIGSVSGTYDTGGLVGFSATGTSISNSYATGNVNGNALTGGLVGNTNGTITNSYATGSVNGTSYTGGLVGFASGSSISNSYATGDVTGSGGVQVGGLVGKNYGSITNAYATGTVTGSGNSMGGLVGLNRGTIGNSFATGNVNSGNAMLTGGLVGANGTGGSITNSYAIGSVTGGTYVGGLAGQNSAGSISNSYATGSTSAVNWVGGLVGQNISSGTVNNSYSSGSVIATNPSNSGTTYAGGLIGSSVSGASATNSFWDITTSGQSTSAGGTGMTTAQMQTQANFTSATAANGSVNPAWDFAGTWVMYDGHTYPLLRSFMSNLVVTTNAATKTYDATAYADTGGVSYSTTPNANLLGTSALTYTDGGQPIINAGTYTNALPGGLYSNQQGYIISYVPGTVTINKATLSVSGESAANKVYDTTNTATLTGGTLVGIMGGDTVTLNQAGTFAGANVGNGIAVTAADSLSGAAAGNYTLAQPVGLAANITPASLVVTGISAGNKVYDTTTSAALSGTPSVTALGSDVVTVTGTGAGTFADPNVGNGKSVTVSGYTLSGTAAGNYSIVEPVGLTANITPASLTVSGQAASNKVYDTTTTATLSGGTLIGVLGGDTVTLTQAGTFASKNVGNGIAVTASDSLGGAAAGNYVLAQPTGLAANITPASLTVSGETAANKVYDATNTASLSGGTLVGVLGGDTLTLNQAGTFASKNVGNGIAVTASDSLGGAAAGNYVLTQPSSLAANITPATLTVSGETAANKVYDTTTTATLSGGTLVGVLGGDAVTLNQAGTFASKNVGNGVAVTVSDSLGGSASSNYVLTQPTGLAANITPASLTVNGETAANKVYDTTTTATLSGGTLVGVLGGDTVTLNQTGTFASKNVGTGIAVTAGDSLGGSAAGNYVLTQPGGLTANITPASLTVSGETASNKVYDSTTTAALSGGALVGVLGGDTVTLNQAGTFASKNVGTGIAVTAGDSLGGAAAGNYVLTQPTGLSANITPANLTVSGETAANKVYDATNAATLSGGTLVGVLGGDAVTLNQAGTFATKNVGNSITVTPTDSLGGTSAGNYVLTQPTGLAANITPASLTVNGETAANKVYDTTTTATLSGGTLVGVLGGDAVTLNQAGTFATKNVGNGIAVTASDSLGGAASGNYVLTQPSGLTANITPASLTVSGETAANKVYDATNAASLSGGSLVGVLGGDTVTLNQAGTFASKNVGTGIAITASDSLGGAAAGNYVLTQPTGLAANITPASLTVNGETAANKVYDRTTTATLSGGTLVGVLGGDTVTLNQAGTFASKNVGNGIAVTASDSLGGSAAGNYVLTQPIGLAANITPASLTVNGETAANKVYDTTTTAALSGGTLVGVLGGDTVTLTQAGTFAGKNVGTGIAVTASDSLGGTDAGNYVLTQPSGLAANITPASVTLNGLTVATKVYDGTTAATMTGTPTVVALGSDVLTISGSGSGAFADPNAGNNKPVAVSGYTLGGAAASNYTLTQVTGVTGTITPASLSVTGETAANKTYDSTTAATLTGGTLVGVIGGDAVTLSQTGVFASKNVGTAIAVTASDTLGGAAAGNYTLVQPTGLSANITAASLTVSGETAASKVYDGTTAATLASGKLVGVFSGDTVTLTEGGAFASKNAGAGVAVTTSDSIGGTSASNYVLVQPTGVTGTITPATLTVSGETAANKVYDGTTAATLSGGSLLGVIGSDAVTLTQTGNFASKNVGTGIAINAADSLAGNAAGNYVLTQPTGLSASITPATLTYTASPVTLTSGQQITGLTGSVSGFVPGDTLSGSTNGTLAWITTAASGSAPGLYAIDGNGLTASNYVFAQAASNANALTLKAGAPSVSVKNVVTAVYATLPSSQTSMQQAMQNTTPTIVVTKVLNNDGAIAELDGTPGPGQDGDSSGTEKIGAIDPVLRIVRSGIKLPDDALNLNE